MRTEMRFESFAPELKHHPFFFHYGFTEPLALRQICQYALEEISLLTKQELFSDIGGDSASFFFVMEGALEYRLPCTCARAENNTKMLARLEEDSDDGWMQAASKLEDESDEKFTSEIVLKNERGRASTHQGAPIADFDRLSKGQWACEAALWCQKVELCSPFVAVEQTEVLLVNNVQFQEIIMRFERTSKKVAQYAECFAGHVPEMCNCRWRTVICNDFSTIEDIVHRYFDFSVVLESKRSMMRSIRGDKSRVQRISDTDEDDMATVAEMDSRKSIGVLGGLKDKIVGFRVSHFDDGSHENSRRQSGVRNSKRQSKGNLGTKGFGDSEASECS